MQGVSFVLKGNHSWALVPRSSIVDGMESSSSNEDGLTFGRVHVMSFY